MQTKKYLSRFLYIFYTFYLIVFLFNHFRQIENFDYYSFELLGIIFALSLVLSFFKKINNSFSYILVLVLSFICGLIITEFSPKEFFNKDGLIGAINIFKSILTPDLSILKKGISLGLETIFMSFVSTLLAIPFALFLSFFMAANLTKSVWQKIIYNFLKFLVSFHRSIETLIWAIIFSVWVGLGVFSGVLALTFHSILSLAKLFAEQIESIDEAPVNAIRMTGANSYQIFYFGVLSQVRNSFLAFIMYRWDINLRTASVIGLVGGGGIGGLLMQYQGQARWNEAGTLIIIIAIIVWGMDYFSMKLRSNLK